MTKKIDAASAKIHEEYLEGLASCLRAFRGISKRDPTPKAMAILESGLRGEDDMKTALTLARIPTDYDGQLATVLAVYRKITGREPTMEEIAEAWKELQS